MNALTPCLTKEEWQQQLSRSVLGISLPGSVVLGQAIILGSEVLPWSSDASLLGLFLTVLPFSVLLIRRRPRLQCYWLIVAYLILSFWVLSWSRTDAAASMLVLPAGLAGLIISPGGGLVTAAIASAGLIIRSGSASAVSSSPSLIALVLVWASTLALWVVTRLSWETVAWSWRQYDQIRVLISEARDQRMELKQTQEDLVRANTELARLADRLAAMRQLAESALHAKEEFVANVSHELRTPLNMIIGFSEIITQSPQVYGVEFPPALLGDLAVIRRNSQHLAGLVDDVLDLSQVEAGRMALSREWSPLSEIIRSAVIAVLPLYESRGLQLDVHLPADLQPLYCDPARIRQVILNLLSNAGRFTERGGAEVSVSAQGDEVLICVSDTGPGIPPEDQARIFDPFEQRDGSIRRRYGGSGLGLAISRRFVEMHSGKMWLESHPGEGAKFFIKLPLEHMPPPPETVTRWFSPHNPYESRGRPSRAPRPEVPPRFVVVESGRTLQRLLRRYLDGVEIVSAPSIQVGVREVNRLPSRALLINDPAYQDASSAAFLSDLPLHTPAISCWIPGEDQTATRMGVRRYLVKPIQREELLTALDSLKTPVGTVLIVDDDQEALQLFARMLMSAQRDYRLFRALNGPRALSLLREKRPDVVLLDLVMPGMDGRQVLREKAQDPALRDIPVIAVSALDPAQGPVSSNHLSVVRSNGLSSHELLTCIQRLSEALDPSREPGDQGHSRCPLA